MKIDKLIININSTLICIILLLFANVKINAGNSNRQNDSIVIPDTIHLCLDSCAAMALRNNTDVKKAMLTVEKAQYEKNALLSMYFPKISANGGIAYVFKDPQVIQSIDGLLPPFEINNSNISNVLLDLVNDALSQLRNDLIAAWEPINISLKGAYMAGLMLTQPVYAGGRIVTGNSMAKLGKVMAEDNLSLKKEEAYYNATQSYWIYVSVLEKVKMAEAYETLLLEAEKMLKNVESVDMLNKNDLLKAQVQLNDVRLSLVQAKNGLELSRMALCHTLGLNYNTIIVPIDTISYEASSEVLDHLPFVPDSAIYDRIEYRLLSNVVEMKDKEVRLLLGEYLPTVGLAASYGIIGGVEIMGNREKPFNLANVMATVSIPITHWWEGSQKIKSAKIDRQIAELEFKDKTRLLELQIRQSTFGFAEAYKQLSNTKFALKQAEENSRLAIDRYAVQLETIVNVLAAQADWQMAYSNMIDAHINYQLKKIEFLRATAQLNLQHNR